MPGKEFTGRLVYKDRYKLIKYESLPDKIKWDVIRAFQYGGTIKLGTLAKRFHYGGAEYVWRLAHDTWYIKLPSAPYLSMVKSISSGAGM